MTLRQSFWLDNGQRLLASSAKWSSIRHQAEDMLQLCLEHHEGGQHVLSDDARWALPGKAQGLPKPCLRVLDPAMVPDDAKVWATVWNLIVHKKYKAVDLRAGYMLIDCDKSPDDALVQGASVWVLPEKSYSFASI